MSAVQVHAVVEGPDDAPVLLLSNSLGADLTMWDPQVPGLTEWFRVVRYDTRGHGRSPVPDGDSTLDDLADDVVALLDRLDVPAAHVVGLSIGGMAALRLAGATPGDVRRLAAVEAVRIGAAGAISGGIAYVCAQRAAMAALGVRDTGRYAIALWAVPFVLVLVVAAEPVVALLLGRGNFDEEAVRLTSLAVTAYSAGLLGLALREPATRAFYALGDSRTPVLLALVANALAGSASPEGGASVSTARPTLKASTSSPAAVPSCSRSASVMRAPLAAASSSPALAVPNWARPSLTSASGLRYTGRPSGKEERISTSSPASRKKPCQSAA